MTKKFLGAKNWGVFMGAWLLETALWVTVVGLVHRGLNLLLSVEAMAWGVALFSSSLAIQAALLRPVSFALASIAAHRIAEFSADLSLILGYVFSLAVTIAVARLTSYEPIFFTPKDPAPALIYFVCGAGIFVAAVWLGFTTLTSQSTDEERA